MTKISKRPFGPVDGFFVLGVVLIVLVAGCESLGAQDVHGTEPTATPAPTPTPSPTPIAPADIAGHAESTAAMLRTAVRTTQIDAEIEGIERAFEQAKTDIGELQKVTSHRLEMNGPASVLEETEREWKQIEAWIDRWQQTLKDRAEAIDGVVEQIGDETAVWQLTLSSADELDLPSAVRREVADTLLALEKTDDAIRARRDAVLTLQSRIATSGEEVANQLAVQREEIVRRRRGIMGLDSPPLWRAFVVPGVDGDPSRQISVMWVGNSRAVRQYLSQQSKLLVRHLLLLIAVAIVLGMLRRQTGVWVRQDRSLERTATLLDRPISASLIATILFASVLYPAAPEAWLDLLGLVLMVALLRILPLMVPDTLRPLAYLLALLYFLERATHLAPDGNLIDRLLLLTLSVSGAMSSWWLDRKLAREHLISSKTWSVLTTFGIRIGLVAFVVGTLANIIGSVGFATLVIEANLSSLFSAVLFWVAAVLARAIVRVVLLTETAKTFGLVRLHADAVRATLFKLITWVAVATWVIWTLRDYTVYDAVKSWVGAVLDTKISLGEFSIQPGTVLLFLLVIWLTFKLSQLIQFGLETDVLPRMDLPRGVPGAITRLTHYAVIVVGVVVAATAAGIDFSRINLIIGALGVGIGFGLQNVVNNFVSGLILLFERPIRVGDRVELNQLSGVVTDIGMRASVVRTWQGADVIVPNANLISSEVVNWTFNDDNHRIEVAVGVAYGTDPEAVIDLLVAAAKAHPAVYRDPEPLALFLGFGDSSLNFELRAWTGSDFVQVASDLRVAVNRALVDAGIEIPFPQRDIHLRSTDVPLGGAGPRLTPGGGAVDREASESPQEMDKKKA